MSDPMENAQRRKWLKQVLTSGALGAAGYAMLVKQAVANVPTEGMQKVKGVVKINGQDAKIGTPVKPGDVVTTGEDSLAVFVVGKDAHLLRSNSRLEVAHESALATAATAALVNVFRLVSGGLLSAYGPGNKKVYTATATMGIRGTGIYIESQPEVSYVCTCYGLVDIASNKSPEAKESVNTKNHEAPRFIYPADAKKIITPAPMKNHTDGELIMLESLLGRRPPFVTDGPSAYG